MIPELTEERKARLLAYCKLTDQADDPEVQALIPGFFADAVAYMSGAGVAPPPEDTPQRAQYDLLVDRMVLDSWDHREMTTAGSITENPAFRRTMNQLKMTAPAGGADAAVSESDTGGKE